MLAIGSNAGNKIPRTLLGRTYNNIVKEIRKQQEKHNFLEIGHNKDSRKCGRFHLGIQNLGS